MKTKTKLMAILLMIVLAMSVFAGCGKSTEDETGTTQKTDIEIAALKGATAIGMVKLMDDAKNGTTANNYNFNIYGTADEITTGLIQGSIDMAAVPCNLASVLYNKTEGGVMVAAINTLGVLYIVETGDTIKTVEDLRGKTIYTTGQGTTPEYTLTYLLNSCGLKIGTDVLVEYKSESTEVVAALASETDAVAMLPQPYVTTAMSANENIRIALDVTQEWEKVSDDSTVVTGVLVVRKEFADANPDAVAAFLEENAASAEYVNDNVEDAANLVEQFDIFKAAVAKTAIPYCNIAFIQGSDMKDKIDGYLNVLYDQNPASVGGKVPDADFYYGV